ncbi:TetR/AcrR family transcriptional regulator [Streptomyces sp. MP131-18]|uniref:TetR/AcrR family transcriptional regulator n=1 Tax=Streptomyces sp. MP131-18 TaxID=1857892 RepID=UPI00097BC54B|nr:TetR/AcrR family transcriptional regulator [Streptomyces sp. MP131-18]ONK11017.1 DNA-binding transcriptional regulator EnvR [Streptomyces sp. MP131-18]
MSQAPRTQRADARRNREQLLDKADAAFRRHGVRASLAEIARSCNIAIGTLYRHFPTREALLEALLRDRIESLRNHAERLAGSPEPLEALIEWLREFGQCSSAYQGLPESVVATAGDEESDLHAGVMSMHAAAGALLTQAQRSGAVRPDVSRAEVLALACGAATASQYGTADPDRLLRLVVEGIRTPAGAAGADG